MKNPVIRLLPITMFAAILASTLAGCSTGVKSVVDQDAEIFSATDTGAATILPGKNGSGNIAQRPLDHSASQYAAAGDSLPPNARAGQCFTKVAVPPEYETVTERKLLSEASERIEIIPASTKTVQKRILVNEATEELTTVPATYKTVSERVLVKSATHKLVHQPAVYETVSEQVIDRPAHSTWKKGTGAIQRIDESTGEIMCLVEVPATYKTIKKRVLKKAASTTTVEIPAVYNTIEKRVVATPATTRSVKTPAKYKTITVTELVSPATEKRIPVAAEYQTVQSKKLVRDSRVEWREILCDTNMTNGKITEIQRALLKAGHNPGPVDGVIGESTMNAVNSFQKANKLPVDRYLNMATVNALGVSAR